MKFIKLSAIYFVNGFICTVVSSADITLVKSNIVFSRKHGISPSDKQ